MGGNARVNSHQSRQHIQRLQTCMPDITRSPRSPRSGSIRVHWVLGLTGLAGNEGVNLLVRDTLHWAPVNGDQPQKCDSSANIILEEYAEAHEQLTPDMNHTRAEQTVIRKTQAPQLHQQDACNKDTCMSHPTVPYLSENTSTHCVAVQ